MAYDKFSTKEENAKEEKEPDEIDSKHKVIVAGFGRLGIDLGRFLISAGVKPTIIDNDASNVDILRNFGFEVYYGDITRLDLLESAGAHEAELLIITISDIEKAKELVNLAKKHYPHLKIAVNAKNRMSAYDMLELGVKTIRVETFGSAVNLGKDALELLGFDPYDVHRKSLIFMKRDKEMLPKLYEIHKKDLKEYIAIYQKHNATLEEVMNFDKNSEKLDNIDKAWTAKNPEL